MTVVPVTVVIPTHSRLDYLAEALQSVVGQQSLPCEVIVVSDVTDHEAGSLVASVAATTSTNVRYVEGSGVSGASGSRNYGASLATSELLAFLDDDDCLEPSYLSTAYAKYRDNDVDLVLTWIDEWNGVEVRAGASPVEGLEPDDVAAINPGATGSNILISHRAFDLIGGFDTNLLVKNDTDFFYRFLRTGKSYGCVQSRLVRQRKHSSGQLTTKSKKRALGTLMYMEKHSATLTMKHRRTLRLYYHRIMASLPGPYPRKIYHLAHMALNYPVTELPRLITSGKIDDADQFREARAGGRFVRHGRAEQ